MVKIVLSVLGLLTLIFLVFFVKDLMNNKERSDTSMVKLIGVGFITDFMDALGIGSFSPTTSLWKLGNMVEDKYIPGSLNVGHTVPVVLEAFMFITVVTVDPLTLVSMLAAATIGAVLAAGVISKLPEDKIKIGMGVALLLVVVIMFAGKMGWMPVGGEATGLTGTKLIIAILGNFILGGLMTIGVGLYAPCMALVSLLGMSPDVAFPIMMGSCAFLMPSAGVRFVKEGAYDRKASLALTIGGVVGVLIATKIFKGLNMNILTWLVIVVILYTAIKMLMEVKKSKQEEAAE